MDFLQIVFSIVLGTISFFAVYVSFKSVNKKIGLLEKEENAGNSEDKSENTSDLYVFPQYSLRKNKTSSLLTGLLFFAFSAISFFIIYNTALTVVLIQISLILLVLISAAIFDYELRIIPNLLSVSAVIIGIVSFIANTVIDYRITGHYKETILSFLLFNILGSILLMIILIVMSLITKNGFGGGDIKLLTALSINFGVVVLIKVLIAALFFSLIVSLIYLAIKKQKKNISLPFAPFIFAGFEFLLFVDKL